MHGLIVMTWEKYLDERFGTRFLHTYRELIGESSASLPLANCLYEDATLVAGVGAASQLAGLPAETLLEEYGRYFILNWLTSHLCMYILTSVESGATSCLPCEMHMRVCDAPKRVYSPAL